MPDDTPPENAPPDSAIAESGENVPVDSQVTPAVTEVPSPVLPPVSIPTPLAEVETTAPPDSPVAEPPPPPPPQPEIAETVLLRPVSYQPAGWIQRAVAYLIDQVIVTLLYGIWMSAGLIGAAGSGNLRALMKSIASPAFAASALWGGLFIFVGYFTFFHGYGGQTPGKMVVRLKVVTAEGGDLSAFRSFCRALGYFVSSFFFGAGFFLALVPPRKRALHDLLTHSQVVLETTPSPAAETTVPHRPLA